MAIIITEILEKARLWGLLLLTLNSVQLYTIKCAGMKIQFRCIKYYCLPIERVVNLQFEALPIS